MGAGFREIGKKSEDGGGGFTEHGKSFEDGGTESFDRGALGRISLRGELLSSFRTSEATVIP